MSQSTKAKLSIMIKILLLLKSYTSLSARFNRTARAGRDEWLRSERRYFSSTRNMHESAACISSAYTAAFRYLTFVVNEMIVKKEKDGGGNSETGTKETSNI